MEEGNRGANLFGPRVAFIQHIDILWHNRYIAHTTLRCLGRGSGYFRPEG